MGCQVFGGGEIQQCPVQLVLDRRQDCNVSHTCKLRRTSSRAVKNSRLQMRIRTLVLPDHLNHSLAEQRNEYPQRDFPPAAARHSASDFLRVNKLQQFQSEALFNHELTDRGAAMTPSSCSSFMAERRLGHVPTIDPKDYLSCWRHFSVKLRSCFATRLGVWLAGNVTPRSRVSVESKSKEEIRCELRVMREISEQLGVSASTVHKTLQQRT